jgi:hypothetical protein
MDKLKRNEKVSQRVRITSYDLLVFTNRGTSGRDYDALCEAIEFRVRRHDCLFRLSDPHGGGERGQVCRRN